MLVLRNSKNYIIVMYNDGEKLKVKIVRQAVSHITAFYAFVQVG